MFIKWLFLFTSDIAYLIALYILEVTKSGRGDSLLHRREAILPPPHNVLDWLFGI